MRGPDLVSECGRFLRKPISSLGPPRNVCVEPAYADLLICVHFRNSYHRRRQCSAPRSIGLRREGEMVRFSWFYLELGVREASKVGFDCDNPLVFRFRNAGKRGFGFS